MKYQRQIIFNNETEQNQTTQTKPGKLIMERTEKKQFYPSNNVKQTNGTNSGIQAITQSIGESGIIEGSIPKESQNAKTETTINNKVEEGYTEGLKSQLKTQRDSGQKDIIEMAKIEGTEDAVKSTVAEIEKNKTKLNDLVANIKTCLFTCKTVFPFDLFPDEITIDPLKITIKGHTFIKSSQLRMIPVKELIDATAETSPFFSTLKIIHQKDTTPIILKPLHRKDAVQACSIIQGLLISNRQNIDISKLPVSQTGPKLEAIGRTQMEI